MLDVHPPHAATHTWKDFFLHIATIVCGLLIAVGLEQGVEAIHRHQERKQLLEGLRSENEQILRDCERVERAFSQRIAWYKQSKAVLSDAARDHNPAAALPPLQTSDFDIPDEPIYRAARSSAKLDLLSDEEAVAYGEIDGIDATVFKSYDRQQDARNQAHNGLQALGFGLAGTDNPLAHATPQQLQALYVQLIAADNEAHSFRDWSRQLRGAAIAVGQGERDLRKIQIAERQFDNVP